MTTQPLTLTAAQVGKLTGYTAPRVRQLFRSGHFPAPIDDSLPTPSWRWSRRRIEEWADGGPANLRFREGRTDDFGGAA
jgi:predicted DNA-binding transcriptional regulator AlpA